MGKMKKRRGHSGRPQPTGVLSQREAAAESGDAQEGRVGGVVSNLVEKLQSTNKEERGCACTMIAGLIEQPEAARQLLSANAVKILGPLVLDHDVAIQNSALGALRNLSAGGSVNCETMMKQDVMTPIEALLKKCQEEPCQDSAKKKCIYELLLQAVHLLWNLCEESDVAVRLFSQDGLMRVLMPYLNAHTYGIDLAAATAQCLYTVTEDNAETARQMAQEREQSVTFLNTVINLQPTEGQEYSYALLKVLTTGLLYNLSVSPPAPVSLDVTSHTIQVLNEVLSIDSGSVTTNLCQTITQKTIAKENGCAGMADEPTPQDSSPSVDMPGAGQDLEVDLHVQDKQLEQLSSSLCDVLTAQQVALEMLANLCCHGDEGEDEWEDVSSNESLGDGDLGNSDMEMEAGNDAPEMPSEVHSLFTSHNQIQKVLCKIEPTDDSVLKTLASNHYGKKVMAGLSDLRERALFCLSNLTTALPADALGGQEGLHRVWTGLSKLVTTLAGAAEPSMLEAATFAMRAVTQKLARANPVAFSEFSTSDLEFLVTLGRQESSAEIRANVISIMSTLGQAVAKQQPPPAIIKDIGVFLLCTVQRDPVLWVQAEALDGIFDVFSEDHLDDIMQTLGLIQRLREVAPVLKTRLNQERCHLGEHLPIVLTAQTNLKRFIKYKSKSNRK